MKAFGEASDASNDRGGLGRGGPPSPAIYRCTAAAGEVMFSDLPCPGGRVEAMRALIEMAGLSADEPATLDRLDRERRS